MYLGYMLPHSKAGHRHMTSLHLNGPMVLIRHFVDTVYHIYLYINTSPHARNKSHLVQENDSSV